MSQETVPAYVTDVSYERTFVHQLTPSTLRVVAALNGVRPPDEDDFDYLELGAANGDSLVALAAANPRARFVGVDINASHVAFANDLARRAGVTNARFLARDFAELDVVALPDFDFVAAHGVLSWVGPEKRRAVLALAQKKLKRGGLLYVSYNALPGWAALEPLRRLMLDASADVEGSTLDRAQHAFAFAQKLAEANASYVTSHPTVKSMLSIMLKAGLPYVVHEYFHAHWHPMYFADVAREMAAHDLAFVGQEPLALNVRELALPPRLKEIVKGETDRIRYESLKDFARNEMFRADVFVKDGDAPSEIATRAYFEHTPFGTIDAAIVRTVKLPIYSLDYTGPVYDAILAEISRGAASASELSARPGLAGLSATRIGDCFSNLALGGQVVPMRRADSRASAVTGTPARYEVPLAYNRVVLEDCLAGGESPRVLSAPAIGACVPLTILELVCIHLLAQVEKGRRASWLRKFSHQKKPRVKCADRVIDSGDELVRVVTREIEKLEASGSAKLVELGILRCVG